eukprot:4499194-Karenia_brevis.AAC.1
MSCSIKTHLQSVGLHAPNRAPIVVSSDLCAPLVRGWATRMLHQFKAEWPSWHAFMLDRLYEVIGKQDVWKTKLMNV